MSGQSDRIGSLKLKLRSVTKLKLSREKDLCKLRNKERSILEALTTLKAETEFLNEQLQDFKGQISQMRHQISMIEICTVSEATKTKTHISYLDSHRKGFHELFNKERDLSELRNKEIQEKEAKEEELLRQKEKQVADKNEQELRETVMIEDECEGIERECVVLKKRNNAIMLKLRRKLFETENTRRELLKRNSHFHHEHVSEKNT